MYCTTDSLFCAYFYQERLESSKRGWELKQLQKLKEEEEERQFMEGDEDLFTYTREDAYNMVGGYFDLCQSNKELWWTVLLCYSLLFFVLQQEYVFDADDDHTEIMPVRLQL